MHLFGVLHFTCNAFSAGCSEVYPLGSLNYAAAQTDLAAIYSARNLLLSQVDVILAGSLISDGDVRGDSYPTTLSVGAPGAYPTVGLATAQPMGLAVPIHAYAGAFKRGTRWLHFLPRDQVGAGGIYSLTGSYGTNLVAYQNTIQSKCMIATRAPGVVPPSWTFTAINSTKNGPAKPRRVGRPFGLPLGKDPIR